MMQSFINEWYNIFETVSVDSGFDASCEEQEKLLLELAKNLQ